MQYNYEGTVTSNPTQGLSTLAAGLSMLLNGAATAADPSHGLGSTVSAAVGADPAAAGFFASQNNQSVSTKPRAYLNVLFFDKKFTFDSVASYSKQIGADGNPGQIVLAKQAARQARKDGYAYVYISNESNDLVYFDNLTLTMEGTPILEETHYYPFGLTMAGISSRAVGGLENKRKYNGIEYENSFDLNIGEAFFRTHDPQLGRWWQIDPKPDYSESLYSSMGNNPILRNDPLGDTPSHSFPASRVNPMKDYFSTNAARHTSGTGDDCITCHIKGMKILTNEPNLKTGGTAKNGTTISDVRKAMQKSGNAEPTKSFGFNDTQGQPAVDAPHAASLNGSIGEYAKRAMNDVGAGESTVFGVSIMDGYHSMTLTATKTIVAPGFTDPLTGITLPPLTTTTFTLSDQGTGVGTVGRGNITFNSADALDNHLTNYVHSNSTASTRSGDPFPAKIELHQIVNNQ